MIQIAQVLKSNGADGEVLLGFRGVDSDEMNLQEPVFIYFDGLPVPFFIEKLTPRGVSKALCRLTGIRSLADAEELAGAAVYADPATLDREEEEAELMLSLGCQEAMNLDGGTSAVMVFMGQIISSPSNMGTASSEGGRKLLDMVLFGEFDAEGNAPALEDIPTEKYTLLNESTTN